MQEDVLGLGYEGAYERLVTAFLSHFIVATTKHSLIYLHRKAHWMQYNLTLAYLYTINTLYLFPSLPESARGVPSVSEYE